MARNSNIQVALLKRCSAITGKNKGIKKRLFLAPLPTFFRRNLVALVLGDGHKASSNLHRRNLPGRYRWYLKTSTATLPRCAPIVIFHLL